MAHALNLTLRLKSGAKTKQKLAHLKETFAIELQPKLDEALRKSQILHFARVLVIDDKYIQVLTEFDGDKKVYTTFFLNALGPIFELVFSMVKDAPPWEEMKHPDKFFEITSRLNLRSLGAKADDPDAGYLFSAYEDKTVKDILAALKES